MKDALNIIKALGYTIVFYMISTAIGCGTPLYIPVVTEVIVFVGWFIVFILFYASGQGVNSKEEKKEGQDEH